MKKILLQNFTAATLAFSFKTGAFAAIYTVSVSNYSFDPANLNVHVGDTIQWVWANGSHTTTSSFIPAGADSWDHPVTQADPVFSYVPAKPGSYDYGSSTSPTPFMVGQFIATSPSSVEEIDAEQVSLVSPNPGRSMAVIRSVDRPEAVELLDILGRRTRLQLMAVSDGLNTYSIENTPVGVYLIKVYVRGRIKIFKLIIES